MARHLCYLTDSSKAKKKAEAVFKLIGEDKKPASFLANDLGLTSRQTSQFLKRIDNVLREKKYNTYRYFVNLSLPQKFTFGDEWVKVNEEDNSIVVTSSNGDVKKIRKDKMEELLE